MAFLTIAAVVCLGLLAGAEFAVSAFINPVLWKLDAVTQAALVRTFARNLGRAMPSWYGGSFLLLVAASAFVRNAPGFSLMVAASAIMAAVIVSSLLFLVPINNRLAKLQAEAWTEKTRRDHRKWDVGHRYRIAALVASLVCVAMAIRS